MKSRHTERARCAAITAGFAAAMVCAAPAGAAPGTGCAAVNRGQLSADIGASAPVTRQIVLEQGDLLSFSTSGASVALIGGAGSPATLVGGTTASAITFKAPMASAYVFQFAATGATAHVSVSCTSTTTEAANAAFLDRRKALLNARDPDRLRIDRAATPIINADKPLNSTVAVDADGRPKDVEFSVSLSEINSATKGGKKVEPGIVDFWLEGRMQNYASTSLDTGTSDGNLGSIYLGTRSMIGPDIMLGALAQFDRAVETSTFNAPGMAAKGWMAGPYVSAKLGSGVTFDGRAAWGETENAVASPEIDDSLTARRLVRGKLTSTREFGGWNVAPSIGLVYVEDAVRDSTSGATRAAGTGKVEVLPEVSKRFALDDVTFIEPRAAVGAFVGFDDLQAINPAVPSVRPTDMQLKAEAGVAYGVKDGSSLQATGGVESGTTSATPQNWSGRLQLNVPLGK
jgi:hypothetical protein